MIEVLIIVLPLVLLGGAVLLLLQRRSAARTEDDKAVVAVPASRTSAADSAAEHAIGEAAVRKPKIAAAREILIVDDQPAIRMLLAEVFQTSGFKVIEAGGGREAIEKYRMEPAAIVLLDLKMPDMDGLEALREIREANRDVTAVLITAYSDPDKLEVARRLGVQRIFTKPFDIEKLRDYVEKQFES